MPIYEEVAHGKPGESSYTNRGDIKVELMWASTVPT
jgi:hypothetical protein